MSLRPARLLKERLTDDVIKHAFRQVQLEEECAVPNCRYELLSEDRFEETCKFITDHYCPDEPLSKNFGIVLNLEPEMKAMTMDDLHQNMTIALISQENDRIIGIQILCVSKKGKINPEEYKAEKTRQLMSFVAYKDTIADVFEHYDVDEVFSLFELAVHRKYRQKGIGCKLMQAAIVFVTSMNIGPCVLKGNCSSNFSKRIYERLAFENYGEVKFDDYKVDGTVVIQDTGEHKSFKMYGKILF